MLLVTHLNGCSKINLQLCGSSYLSNHSSWWILKFCVENLVTLGQIYEFIECCCVYFVIKVFFFCCLLSFQVFGANKNSPTDYNGLFKIMII